MDLLVFTDMTMFPRIGQPEIVVDDFCKFSSSSSWSVWGWVVIASAKVIAVTEAFWVDWK